jgi:two-component system, OmpR family, sensor histidine kinase ChvG
MAQTIEAPFDSADTTRAGTPADIRPGAERFVDPVARDESSKPSWWKARVGALPGSIKALWSGRKRTTRFARRSRFSSLTRRIILFNITALVIFIAGVVYININRVGLTEERILSLSTQGRIIAAALAESATLGPESTEVDDELAIPLMRQLTAPTATRARLYAKDGKMKLDTRYLLARNIVETNRLPPPGSAFDTWLIVDKIYDFLSLWAPARNYPQYQEVLGGSGLLYDEVREARKGHVASAVRINESNDLMITVAVPVQRYQLVLGVLLLSTEGEDIDEVLRAERLMLLQLALIALVILVVSSLYLAGTIGRPMRQLADAAEAVRRVTGDRPEIPDFGKRKDEIGDLSLALRDMTNGLYSRIAAIEQFAADVAHEIKNPLTSLSSAVQIIRSVKDDETRRKMVDLIANDVQRINRLVSDISDASRLDAELAREKLLPVDLPKLLETVASIYERDDPKAVRVAVTIDGSAQGFDGLMISGLDGPLAQVFRNLFDNAVSFSPESSVVTVNVSRRGGLAIVTVDDHGPGMPEENLKSIFGRFYTERPASHGFGKNSGLGLSIAKQIVELHGGTIEAQNRRDHPGGDVRGARFIVTLPASGRA